MRAEQEVIPVYMLTGFLESGKTTMIQSMLTDEGFSRGQKTLIICCEEGIEEYDPDVLNEQNAVLVTLEEPEEWTALKLKELNSRYNPERVIVEYNTMWTLERLGGTRLPPAWEWVQVITLADATTFENYMTNLRKLLTDPMKEADLILINRCAPDFQKSVWRRQLRALNPNANILFENLDGTTEDGVSDEDLPYDMKADIIDMTEEQVGIFYLDALDHPERYDGKTVRLVGTPFPDREFPAGYYYFGRFAMTCCSNDIQKVGWVCQGKTRPNARTFIRLTAKCQKVVSDDGAQTALMMHEISTEPAPAPKEKYISFTNAV